LSIKNDIKMVKEELTSEEKFFEKSVITERFIKKYKNLIIGSIIVIMLLVTAKIGYDANKESTIESANVALNELLKDSKNEKELAALKDLSPNLYDAFMYSTAIANKDRKSLEKLHDSKSLLIGDLARYETAKSAEDLSAYSLKESAIYKELAEVQSAIILINKGKIEEAHEKLRLISDDSSLSKVSKALLHYGVK